MTKKIETLVPDIYKLFDKGAEVSDVQATAFGTEMAEMLKSRLKLD